MSAPADPLVTTEWLFERLDAPDIAILDASWFMPGSPTDARQEFAAGHIPGAVFFDIDQISDRSSALPHMLPSSGEFAAAVRRLGVRASQTIVVYDSQGIFSAPRAWWTFRVMGHDAVLVLDGGLPAWTRDGRPLESGWPVPTRGDFKARANPALVRDLEAVRAELASHGAQIVDARPAARFTGEAPEPRAGLRGGHMPGALNLPWADLIVADGRMAEAPALADAFTAAGVDLALPITTSCGSGISASVLALALARLGRTDVAVYDGSWSEWGARADTPVATGR